MDMFNEKIETHVDNPKGNLLSNMSQEVKSILSAIFRDDYGGEKTEKTTEEILGIPGKVVGFAVGAAVGSVKGVFKALGSIGKKTA